MFSPPPLGGSDSYNDALSKKRAESVKAWLISRDELKNFSLEAIGRGERYPIAPNSQPNGNDDPEGRQKNRRVEVEIPKN
jgi:outer membrane protein OmpA-like peptidoglycan-associated protein